MARIFEVVVQSLYAAQVFVNKFNYVADVDVAAGGSLALATALGGVYAAEGGLGRPPVGSLFHAWLEAVSNQYELDQLLVRAIKNDNDFYQNPFPNQPNGAFGGDPASPALTYKLRSTRTTLAIRAGQKAIGGVSEDGMSGGGIISGGMVSRLQALAEEMSVVLATTISAAAVNFSPAVCKLEKYNVPGTSPVRTAYKYYATEAEQIANTAFPVSWNPVNTVRTQTSRQYGRGI